MEVAQYPTGDKIKELMKGPAETPVVMLNLLSFKEVADGENQGLSGLDAYSKYARKMTTLVESKGGRLIWSGRVDSFVIGESDTDFQMIALMEYPNRAAFLEIASSVEVQEIAQDRVDGLAGQWLLATTQAGL